MLNRLTTLVTEHPRRVLAATAALFAVAVVLGGPVAGLLSTGDDFADPGSESSAAETRLTTAAGREPAPSVLALVRPGGSVASARGEIGSLASEMERVPGVAEALTAFERGGGSAISRDGRSTYIAVFTRAGTERSEVAAELVRRFEGRPGLTLGGPEVIGDTVGDQVGEDLARAEMIALPILLVLLLFVFRGVVAAMLPLFVGVLTIFGTFLGLRLVNEVELLSVFALNLATALGLGLAIDYSLFVLSRYREEIGRGSSERAALRATMAAAGRTVAFSSLTVATALLALTVFPHRFLYSMGISGALSAALAGIVSLIALPALIAALGPRVEAGRLGRRRAAGKPAHEGRAFWYRLSHAVMRRPAAVATTTAAVLVLLGLPFLGIKFTGVDAGVLDEGSGARQVETALARDFPGAATAPIQAVVPDAPAATVARYRDRIAEVPGVDSVSPPRAVGRDLALIEVAHRRPPLDERALELVRAVRATPAPPGTQVGGRSAARLDQQDALGDHLPAALAILVVTTLLILFLMTGSVVLPVKALLMNLLTLSATFGFLVLVFQDGRFEDLLGYTSQGALESTQPLVLAAIAFGLSTDYGVFLLARIKEEHDRGRPTPEAVALGVQRTGRIVTAAAVLLSVALGAFATSEIVFIKQLGLGAVIAVLIDATIVRALLVPSLMALLGRANWWAPAPLRRIHDRLGMAGA